MNQTLGRPVRYRCDLSARLGLEGSAPILVRVLDVSETGAFAATEDDLEFGAFGMLRLPLPGGEPFDIRVRVARLGTSQLEIRHKTVDNIAVIRRGVGLEFEGIPDDELERLRGFLEILDQR